MHGHAEENKYSVLERTTASDQTEHKNQNHPDKITVPEITFLLVHKTHVT